MTKNIHKYPRMMDNELLRACGAAYNNLYSDLKLNFYTALEIRDPEA